jgi:hypothetical protein
MALKLIYVVVVAATHTPPCHARPYANPVHSFKWIAGIAVGVSCSPRR